MTKKEMIKIMNQEFQDYYDTDSDYSILSEYLLETLMNEGMFQDIFEKLSTSVEVQEVIKKHIES